jgi:hypothetical protein
MTTLSEITAAVRAPQLSGQTVVVIGGSSGMAVHIMTNTALTGATYDIDGGQQLRPDEE